MTLILILALIGYITIGFGVGKGIRSLREYDWRRHQRTKTKLMCSTDGNGETEDISFWMGIFWLPFGLLSLGWHYNRISWDKEERNLMKQLNQEHQRTTVRKLQETLDRSREERRKHLEEELRKMEAENL